jgi:ribosomal protein S27E
MIYIKCKKCGWRLPFSGKRNDDTIRSRGDINIICPNCGQMLIKQGGKWNAWK